MRSSPLPPSPFPLLSADLAVDLPAAVRLQRLVGSLRTHFRCGAVALLLLEDEHLRPVAVDGLVSDALGRRFAIRDHPRLATILQGRGVTSFDHDSRLPDPYDGLIAGHAGVPLPVHDCMGMTLSVDGERWGLVTLDALDVGTFTDRARQSLAELACAIEAAIRVTRLETENRALKLARGAAPGALRSAGDGAEIIGHSPAMTRLLHELQVVADSELPVLLLGETGVGKELFAMRLHRLSQRAARPLVHVNCAALPESLAESELFGHVRGAFSGATTDRPGRFETAHGGTLFLDEVGELSLAVQAKLLRALQNGEIQRLGADQHRQVDVRVIAATNRSLQDLVRDGAFRADLYHRLSVYPIPIPPLRERDGDALLIAGRFLELNRARLGLRGLRLSAAAEAALRRYPWPGNVRELEHVMSRAALKAISRGADRRSIVTLEAELLDLDPAMAPAPRPPAGIADGGGEPSGREPSGREPSGREPSGSETSGGQSSAGPASAGETFAGAGRTVDSGPPPAGLHAAAPRPLHDVVRAAQAQAIRQALAVHHGNWSAAARDLALDASNLHKLARRVGLKADGIDRGRQAAGPGQRKVGRLLATSLRSRP